jgi:cyclomaltodextrinase / maltogenic alpha-amylase / neopullulanase
MDNLFEIRVKKEFEKFAKREKDFRNGAVVYQVLVDRFAPSENIEGKKDLYLYPKVLKPWSETPKPGLFNKDVKYWQHELEYWGGDLKSVISKLDYIKNLGVDVLYLNPIFESLSNHKYDAIDYMKISKEYGTKKDLIELCNKLHQKDMKLILDGVFNHVGIHNPIFKEAQDSNSEKHDWFDFNEKYPKGVRLWADVPSMPEWNLENEKVRDYLYRSKDSVIKSYLRDGIDGWRLDVAFDIGYKFLSELTENAHEEKKGSLVVGEIWNYPKDWLDSIDGVMNFTFRELTKRVLNGNLSPRQANTYLDQIISDSNIEGLLKSWVLLDNHDTARLTDQIKDDENRKLAQILQFTLPGSPNIYYGSELGMQGGNEPLSRAPMRWDKVDPSNETYLWTQSLISMHQNQRALKIGDFVSTKAENIIAFERKTDRVEDTILVFINPSDEQVTEDILISDSKIMNFSNFDVILGKGEIIDFWAGFIRVSLKPKTYLVAKPNVEVNESYTPYKRV